MKPITRLIRRFFGIFSDGQDTDSRESEITVEREPQTASEDAVKGITDDELSDAEPAADGDEQSEPAEIEQQESEPAETGDDADRPEQSDSAAEADPSVEDASDEAEQSAVEGGTGEPVEEIRGIGPTYSDRLGEIGIETVGELADSDPAAVADAAQVSESRASEWIERAGNVR